VGLGARRPLCRPPPGEVTAYVGSGQIGDWPAAELASYEFALAEAERVDSRRSLKKLRAIGPPPYGAAAVFTERTCLSRLEGRMGPRGLLAMTRALLGGKEASVLDLPGMFRGFRFSMDSMWPEVSRIDLNERAPVLEMPVFFLLGRQDHWVPVQTSLAYFESMTAPRKELVWFEHSGHEPFVDEPAKFNSAVVELVGPLFTAGSARLP
jgi:pimeloyl-ACP methyl ester carboxylesterase